MAGPALSTLLNNYPDTFAFVQIHHGDGYATGWGNARANFYSLPGYPTIYFDGVDAMIGAYSYSAYRNEYLYRRTVPTDVTITLTGEPVSGQTYSIEAEVCIEPTGSSKTMRIYMVQLLDYWPIPPSYSRNGFKQAAATQDITLSPGECETIRRNFTFDATSWASQSNIKIIAWAQEPQSSSPPSNRAEVYQAGIMGWPFPPPIVLEACCLPTDNCIETGSGDCLSQGGDPKGPGTDCLVPWLYGDVDGNGDVNLTDLLCELDGLSGLFACPGVVFEDLDIHPCIVGDGDLNLSDLLALLDALRGLPACPSCP